MDAVDRFATDAAQFGQWALHGTDEGECAARQALSLLTRLYSAGLELRQAWTEEQAELPAEPVDDDEWRAVLDATGRLPLGYYSQVFDPLPFPPNEPSMRTLGDDIADIYRDVVRGLREYQAGRRGEAI